jgi:hypothetical protein
VHCLAANQHQVCCNLISHVTNQHAAALHALLKDVS